MLDIHKSTLNFKIFPNKIRSACKNNDELKIVLGNFEQNFDCIVLTETHIILEPYIYNLSGYNTFYNGG